MLTACFLGRYTQLCRITGVYCSKGLITNLNFMLNIVGLLNTRRAKLLSQVIWSGYIK